MQVENLNRHKKLADNNIVDTLETIVRAANQVYIGDPMVQQLFPSPIAIFRDDLESMLSKEVGVESAKVELLQLGPDTRKIRVVLI